MPAVKGYHFGFFTLQVEVIERPDVDRVQLRSGTRPRKRVNPANLAEVVLGDHGSELVSTQLLLTRQQAKVFWRDAMVQDALLRANRAIALSDAIDDRVDLVADGTAVTASNVARHIDKP